MDHYGGPRSPLRHLFYPIFWINGSLSSINAADHINQFNNMALFYDVCKGFDSESTKKQFVLFKSFEAFLFIINKKLAEKNIDLSSDGSAIV